MLPIYPLDGGRVLKEILTLQNGKEKAYYITNITSKICVIILTLLTSILILYIRNIALIIILTYLWYLVIKNEKIYRFKKKIYAQLKK